ncbi:hypothetical protein HK405_011544 [Cladochytrium tenue]|nr:hypothetical protein HK405_011544 [Cladochytrium tenue]
MISYCIQDKEVATAVAGYLKGKGYSVWIDTSKTHDLINQAVLDAIQDSRVIMPFLSDAYVGSRNCKLELAYALSQHQKKFLPVRLSSAPDAVVFSAGTSIINLNQDVWQNNSARAAALKSIILNLPDRRENQSLTKTKYFRLLCIAITVIIILLAVAIALAVHFVRSNNGGGSGGGDSSSTTTTSRASASVVGTSTNSITSGVKTTSSSTVSSASTATSSASFGGTTITLPTYFQIQQSGTDSCMVPSASGASFATCETSPASDSTQVLTAPSGNGGNWKHTATGECLSFDAFYLTLATCSSTNTFQELTIVENTISDGFSTCLPDNLQTLGGSGCGSFAVVQVAA